MITKSWEMILQRCNVCKNTAERWELERALDDSFGI